MEILIIDDEPLVAKALGRLLRPHSVRIITSSQSALGALSQDHFDLIFCDLMMPGLAGSELHARACARNPELSESFVFITGGALGGESEKFLSRRDVRVLYKPFDRGQLRSLLDSVSATGP